MRHAPMPSMAPHFISALKRRLESEKEPAEVVEVAEVSDVADGCTGKTPVAFSYR